MFAYFSENDFDSGAIKKILEGYDYELTDIEERNWNKVWETNFDPVRVEDFCLVRAEFHEPSDSVEYEIIITPKMSFGTGHHATTYMMMMQMREMDFQNKSVFDFGTGTGLLAILAERLGAESVVAIDVDDWSIENAKENLDRNGCQKIAVSKSSLVPDQIFDIILANINRNVILDNVQSIVRSTKPGGHVLLSGLLETDETEIVEAAKKEGLQLKKQLLRNGWISLLFVN
jgi:ribosomal protein L11 methyltransferase